MLRIKILHKKNHPFTNSIKVYGISIEAILIIFFILIVVLLVAAYRKPITKIKEPGYVQTKII